MGFPCGSVSKESTCNAVDLGSIPGLGRSPGGSRGNPLQYSCLENPHGQRSLVGYSQKCCRVGHDWETKHACVHRHLHLLCYRLCDPWAGGGRDSLLLACEAQSTCPSVWFQRENEQDAYVCNVTPWGCAKWLTEWTSEWGKGWINVEGMHL